MYGGTEFGLIALQTWDHDTMTFVPDLNFLEFIPEDEHLKSRRDPGYTPRTVLLDQVEANQVYEVVITNFHGGPFVRYRIGDMIRIVSRRNQRLDIDIPQMIFETRCDDVIDLANFARLTERTIWLALEESGAHYVDWTARKELEADQPVLQIYIEPKNGNPVGERDIEALMGDSLKRVDSDYRDLEEMLGLRLLRVSFLPTGSFERYTAARQAEGADPAHLKPPHMRPGDKVIAQLKAPVHGNG
jgi:hypothetical protein